MANFESQLTTQPRNWKSICKEKYFLIFIPKNRQKTQDSYLPKIKENASNYAY